MLIQQEEIDRHVFRNAPAHKSKYVLLPLNRIVDTGEEKIHEQNENGRYHSCKIFNPLYVNTLLRSNPN
jgi:hypothetical protein